MTRRTYRAQDVAMFLLAAADPEDNDISNLKLQKLCYYAQGIISAMRGKALFSDSIEAWDHGPVIPSLYHEYKQHGSAPIPTVDDFDAALFDQSDQKALRDVLEYYGQFSPWRLRNMTHDEPPWTSAYNQENRRITLDSMVAHFRPVIDDSYVASIYGEGPTNKAAKT